MWVECTIACLANVAYYVSNDSRSVGIFVTGQIDNLMMRVVQNRPYQRVEACIYTYINIKCLLVSAN